jgi:hypothetical protein
MEDKMNKVSLGNDKKNKEKYDKPEINSIRIDNEISMVMMSAGPGDDPPEEVSLGDCINRSPFKLFK